MISEDEPKSDIEPLRYPGAQPDKKRKKINPVLVDQCVQRFKLKDITYYRNSLPKLETFIGCAKSWYNQYPK